MHKFSLLNQYKKYIKKLEFNNKLNKFNINCYPYALSDFTGKAKIFVPKNSEHVYSVTVNKNLNSSKTEVITEEIDTITLYEFIIKK